MQPTNNDVRWDATPVENLQRCGLKVFFETDAPDAEPDVRVFIPVFHHWIRTSAVAGLLIDVADYTHLADGPAVLLAGHEGNYAIDRADGRTGLCYYRKQPVGGALADRLAALARTLLAAAVLLESEPAGAARCRFRGDELQFVANDRLLAPPEPATAAALRPHLAGFARRLFGADAAAEPAPTAGRDRLRFTLRARRAAPLAELLGRLS